MTKLKLKLIIGDMNAKIGREEVYKSTIEKHRLHYIETNKNGEMLIDYATSRNMLLPRQSSLTEIYTRKLG